jgi:hypothetical protein
MCRLPHPRHGLTAEVSDVHQPDITGGTAVHGRDGTTATAMIPTAASRRPLRSARRQERRYRHGRIAEARRCGRRSSAQPPKQPPASRPADYPFRTGAATLAIRTSALRLCNQATRSARTDPLASCWAFRSLRAHFASAICGRDKGVMARVDFRLGLRLARLSTLSQSE